MAAFTSLAEESLDVLMTARADFRTAAHFADQAGIGVRVGDAPHFAIASGHGTTLWTLDHKLLQAAPAVAVSAKEP